MDAVIPLCWGKGYLSASTQTGQPDGGTLLSKELSPLLRGNRS